MKSLMVRAAVLLALLATTARAQESPNAPDTAGKQGPTVTEPEDKTGQAIDEAAESTKSAIEAAKDAAIKAIEKADQAMLQAKRAGRNKTIIAGISTNGLVHPGSTEVE